MSFHIQKVITQIDRRHEDGKGKHGRPLCCFAGAKRLPDVHKVENNFCRSKSGCQGKQQLSSPLKHYLLDESQPQVGIQHEKVNHRRKQRWSLNNIQITNGCHPRTIDTGS